MFFFFCFSNCCYQKVKLLDIMPQTRQVQSLYKITLKAVNTSLCNLAELNDCTPDLQTWIKSNLHHNIKEELLFQYNLWQKPYNLNYMKFLIDCTLNKLVLNECLSSRVMSGVDYIEFMKYLHGENIEHLYNLSLHFKTVNTFSFYLYLLFSKHSRLWRVNMQAALVGVLCRTGSPKLEPQVQDPPSAWYLKWW